MNTDDPDVGEFLRMMRAAPSGSRVDVLIRIACIATADQLAGMLDGAMNAMIVLEHEFERRFPKEHAEWERRTEGE